MASSGTIIPPGIWKVFSKVGESLFLNLIVASTTPRYINSVEAPEIIASCLNPPIDANNKPKAV